ncbi:hypothetical protein BXY53_2041 [Dichotomicrobium thermohalophilum]|uniref:Helix-turn-helix protein n=2 Tax=Dichotomicrobium thermohalophilum TaxID=933063 RepID=A0A397PEV1_9HYPH|nr:hypothetical protein BXY53_2041 [Dichotomicrobium thermohalophilum]
MALAGLGLSVREFADKAKVAPGTLTRLARGEKLQERTVSAIRQAFEEEGIEFIDANGGGPGVRLRKRV